MRKALLSALILSVLAMATPGVAAADDSPAVAADAAAQLETAVRAAHAVLEAGDSNVCDDFGSVFLECSYEVTGAPAGSYGATVQATATVTVCTVVACTRIPVVLTRTGAFVTPGASVETTPGPSVVVVRPICVASVCTPVIELQGPGDFTVRVFSESPDVAVYAPTSDSPITVNTPQTCVSTSGQCGDGEPGAGS